MRTVSNAMLIISGVYLALGLIYLRFWWAERKRRDYLAFTLCALSVTLFSWFELGMMHSLTPEEYLFYTWWNYLIGILPTLSIAWFAYENLRGRRWLFLTYCAFRLLGVFVHLLMPNGINFREVTSVGRMTVLGEALSYPIAIPNPWMILPHLSHVLLLIFCIDASIRAWRRGERRKALIFGTSVFLYRAVSSITTIGVLWGLVRFPFFVSFSIVFVIAAMIYELNYDMHRAAMLTKELAERDARLTETFEKLQEREALLSDTLEQLQLTAAAANVGMWTRKIGEETIWFSEKAGEIWGTPGREQITPKDIIQIVHPDDRERFSISVRELEEGKTEFQHEFRILLDDGTVRWIYSRGKVEPEGGIRIVRGAIVDITKLKMAEEAVHDLSRRLMNAQEKERARLARELHDDLSQSVALLSIQLSGLRNESNDLDYMKNQLDHFVSDIGRLSGDIHRISHELHPAKISQLGLEVALKCIIRVLSASHPLKIDFAAENLPRYLPDDVSLCLYRIVQESLQNVIKHSRASSAEVKIKLEHGSIILSVSDNGEGFDPKANKSKEALGLISIEERVRTVNGKAKITSAIGTGTKVEVHIPID